MDLATNLAALIAGWKSRRAPARELDGLGCDERDAFARDLRLSPEQLVQLATSRIDAGQQLIRLMDTLEVDPGEVDRLAPGVLRDLHVVCSGCRSVKRCHQELAAGRAQATFEEYCPNAETLVALTRFLARVPRTYGSR